jgi:hypothetical protein
MASSRGTVSTSLPTSSQNTNSITKENMKKGTPQHASAARTQLFSQLSAAAMLIGVFVIYAFLQERMVPSLSCVCGLVVCLSHARTSLNSLEPSNSRTLCEISPSLEHMDPHTLS